MRPAGHDGAQIVKTPYVTTIVLQFAVNFEWDDAKAATNLRKHGFEFESACRVFFDTRRIERLDGREDYGEDRWVTVGSVDGSVVAVAYTVRGIDPEITRLISARKADAAERRKYHASI